MPSAGSVLLIEEEPATRQALSDCLERAGYSVLQAGSGREALEQLRQAISPPSVIVLDLQMPVRDGFAFRDQQLLDARLARIPTVVVTGHENLVANAAALRAQGVLKKPVQPKSLLDEVVRVAAER